jgi:hypothetical protein
MKLTKKRIEELNKLGENEAKRRRGMLVDDIRIVLGENSDGILNFIIEAIRKASER